MTTRGNGPHGADGTEALGLLAFRLLSDPIFVSFCILRNLLDDAWIGFSVDEARFDKVHQQKARHDGEEARENVIPQGFEPQPAKAPGLGGWRG